MTNRQQGSGGPNWQQGPPPGAGDNVIQKAAGLAPRIVRGESIDDAGVLVEQAMAVGRHLSQQRLTTAQIRNVFGTVRAIESRWRLTEIGRGNTQQDPEETEKRAREALRELHLLKPRLAYAASRQRVVGQLAAVLNPAIDEVVAAQNNPATAHARFTHFLDFFEAILAYHREAGGR